MFERHTPKFMLSNFNSLPRDGRVSLALSSVFKAALLLGRELPFRRQEACQGCAGCATETGKQFVKMLILIQQRERLAGRQTRNTRACARAPVAYPPFAGASGGRAAGTLTEKGATDDVEGQLAVRVQQHAEDEVADDGTRAARHEVQADRHGPADSVYGIR